MRDFSLTRFFALCSRINTPIPLALGLFLALLAAVVPAHAQKPSTPDDQAMYAGGRRYPLKPSTRWSGVVVEDKDDRNAILRRVKTRLGAGDAAAVQYYPRHRIALVAGTGGRTLTTPIEGVNHPVRVYGDTNLPVIDTTELLIQFSHNVSRREIEVRLAKHGAALVEKLGPYAPNGYKARILRPEQTSTLAVANALYVTPGVIFSHPNFIWPHQKKLVPNDPRYPDQWHLKNNGQGGGQAGADISAEAAWDVTRGSGNIIIAINDDGVDLSHEDFQANKLVPGYDFAGNDNDPRPGGGDDHGTACAGVATANGNNAIGVTGIAPDCKLMPVRLIASGATLQDEADAFRFMADNGASVISNSWGPIDGFGESQPMADSTRAAIDYATDTGRSGKGCVILFAAGNGNESADLDGYASYDRVISVAASTNFDRKAQYSDYGLTVDVCAPSNGGSLGITTTDRMGEPGYDSGNYTSSFGGTSSATPLVAGVAALVLSVNPALTYTQVREILQNTADKIDLSGGNYNTSGHSVFYGYGRVNALRAVNAATVPPAQVTLLAPRDNETVGGNYLMRATTTNDSVVRRMEFQRRSPGTSFTRTPNLPINDFSNVSDTAVLSTPGLVEAASVSVEIRHTFIGDLVVTLVAPDGSRHVLHNRDGGSTDNLITTYTNVPVQGRSIAGQWRLEISDEAGADVGTFVSWGMTFNSAWSTVAVDSDGPSGGQWTGVWNTGVGTSSPAGVYEVRAVAITAGANYTDTSSNVTVTPVGITLVTPADNATVAGNYLMRARTTNDALVQRVEFARRRPASTYTRSPRLTLVDNSEVTDTLRVSGQTGLTGEVTVSVDITHDYIGDLQVELIAPDGTSHVLHANTGGSERNLSRTYYNVPLTGKPMSGDWKLVVTDGLSQDAGTFNSWRLILAPEWITIGTDTQPGNGEWNTIWNANGTDSGRYDVRALAVLGTQSAFDINSNVNVISNTYSVSGRVTTSSGAGVAGVTIARGGGTNTATTNALGYYTLSGIPPGTYTLTPAKTGYSFLPVSRAVVVRSTPIDNLNFQAIAAPPDRTAPTATITDPANGSFTSNPVRVTGTAGDNTGGSGLRRVTVMLYRYAAGTTAAGWWAGGTATNFTAPYNATVHERLATGTGSWTLTLPAGLPNGRYLVRATATDVAGNLGRSASHTFTVDRTAPTVTITRPTAGSSQTASALSTATGTAADNAGGSGIARVTVMLYRYAATGVTAGYWGGGTTFSPTFNAAQHERLATGTTSWSLTLPTLLPTRYLLRATATDRVGLSTRSTTITFAVTASQSSAVQPAPTPLPTPTPVPTPIATSPVSLSAGTAYALTGMIRLQWSSGLNAPTAADVARYNVQVNGRTVAVESAAYSSVNHTVTLLLAEPAVAPGSTLTISWSGLQDAFNRPLASGSTTLMAR